MQVQAHCNPRSCGCKELSLQREQNEKKNKNGAQQNLYAMPFGTLRIAKPL